MQLGIIPDEFTYVEDYNIIADIKYATDDNFTSRKVDGYESNKIILTKEAAAALIKVQADLTPQGYKLKILDAFRPTRAVDDFMKWRDEPADLNLKAKYYSNLAKEDLFKLGFIAPGKSDVSTVFRTTNQAAIANFSNSVGAR